MSNKAVEFIITEYKDHNLVHFKMVREDIKRQDVKDFLDEQTLDLVTYALLNNDIDVVKFQIICNSYLSSGSLVNELLDNLSSKIFIRDDHLRHDLLFKDFMELPTNGSLDEKAQQKLALKVSYLFDLLNNNGHFINYKELSFEVLHNLSSRGSGTIYDSFLADLDRFGQNNGPRSTSM